MDRKDTYTVGRRTSKHRLLPFDSLEWLVGAKLKILGGYHFQDGEHPDGDIVVVGDYPKTLLVEMTWKRSRWGLDLEPRTYRTAIPKASIVCGDVRLQTVDGTMITPDMVSALGYVDD